MTPIVEDFANIAAEMKRIDAFDEAGVVLVEKARAEEAARPPKPELQKLPWSFLPGMPHKLTEPAACESSWLPIPAPVTSWIKEIPDWSGSGVVTEYFADGTVKTVNHGAFTFTSRNSGTLDPVTMTWVDIDGYELADSVEPVTMTWAELEELLAEASD
jgi:hypothetical protein